MFNPSRRALLTASGALALSAAAPSLALADAAAATVSATWDLSDLYASDAAWQAEFDRVRALLPKLETYKGTLGASPAALKTALQAISDVSRAVMRLDIYAGLKADLDNHSAPDQQRRGDTQNLETALAEATAWVSPQVLALGAAKVKAFVAADPGLAKFRFGLDEILRAAPHTLSEEKEALLAAAGTPLNGPQDVFGLLTNADIPWPEITLSTGEKVKLDNAGYTKVREAADRDDRHRVMTTFFSAYGQYEGAIGANYAAKINGDAFLARAHHFDSGLQASLFANGVDEGVYRTLVAECNAGLPQLHRYFKLRQKLLGLPDMGYWDIYPPVVKLEKRFDLDTMRTLTLEAMKPLGESYVSVLAKGTAAKWMDARPRPGKTSGAYMNGEA